MCGQRTLQIRSISLSGLAAAMSQVDHIIIAEQNLGQMYHMVRAEAAPTPVHLMAKPAGMPQLPKEILDKILHDSEDGKPVVEELKTLTLLNIDIRGFSHLAKEIGTQKTVAMLNSFFSVMGGVVFKHHGIVDKYLGDGFLAFFGAPVSSTRDADNAVAAALEMKRSLATVNNYLSKTFDATVEMGISVHTGEVVVGNIGFEKKMDYTVIGDSVNTVFRLQNITKSFPNGILISENTLRAARSSLEVGG